MRALLALSLAAALSLPALAQKPSPFAGDARLEKRITVRWKKATLYDALRVSTAPKKPIGHGSLDLTLENSTLTLRELRYFNRGVEARAASISIANIFKLPDSPLDGYIVGSARPLADIKLPFFADVDQILTVLQSGLTTVKIEGTVRNPKAKIVPFSEVSDALRRLLIGDVKGENASEP